MQTKKLSANGKLYIYFGVFALIVGLIAFGSSPLYPLNEWADPNVFMTVGRTMLDGKVLYRDIYEQKGFYVYFIHAFSALISNKSFLGIFFLELLLFFTTLFFSSKILQVYGVESVKTRGVICSLLGVSFAFSFALSWGDSVEEFVLPFFIIMIYATVKHIKHDEEFKMWEHFLIGIFSAYVFWSKFSLVAFFIGWFVFYVYRCIKRKKVAHIFLCVGFVILGFIVGTLPGLIYFLCHGAIKDCLQVYIYDNIFRYPSEGGIFYKLWKVLTSTLRAIGYNPHYGIFVLLGMVFFCWKKRGEERMFMILVPTITTFFLFIGGRYYRYYGLPLYMFAIFGYIALTEWGVEKFFAKQKWTRIVTPILAVCSCFTYFCINGNIFRIFRSKDTLAQYQVAEYIKEHGDEDALILEYGFLDTGFYLACEQVPPYKFFCEFNIPLEEMKEEMDAYVESGKVDYVVTELWYKDNGYARRRAEINEKMKNRADYKQVKEIHTRNRGTKVTYILYERIA